jgi:hypothetical protein
VTELSTKGYGTKSIASIMQVPENVIAEDLASIAKSGGFVTVDDFVSPSTINNTATITNSYTNNNIDRIKRYTASVSPHTTKYYDIDRIADDILAKYHTQDDSMPEDIRREYIGKDPAVLASVQNAYNRLRNNSIKARELRSRVEGKLYDADTEEGKEEDAHENLEKQLAILEGEI